MRFAILTFLAVLMFQISIPFSFAGERLPSCDSVDQKISDIKSKIEGHQKEAFTIQSRMAEPTAGQLEKTECDFRMIKVLHEIQKLESSKFDLLYAKFSSACR